MSPIISFRDDGPKPPPFSSSPPPPPRSLPPSSADGRRASSFDPLDEDDLPAFSVSRSDGPSAGPYPSAKIKPPGSDAAGGGRALKQPRLSARQRSGDYGGREHENDGADDAGLLQYEMDVLDDSAAGGGGGSSDGLAGESVARRRERGEAIISGGRGVGGWLGMRRPSPAGTKEILGIIYEVRRTERALSTCLRGG